MKGETKKERIIRREKKRVMLDEKHKEEHELTLNLLKESKLSEITYVTGCLVNEYEIVKINKRINQCPISVASVQMYADSFEESNRHHNEVVFELKKMSKKIDKMDKKIQENKGLKKQLETILKLVKKL